jgi:hypothetical protein
MIGSLPKELNINGTYRAIRTDFRVALLIFQAYNDVELSDQEKTAVMLECLYEDLENIPEADQEEAMNQGVWYLEGGKVEDNKKYQYAKKVMDWEQDEQIIFSAINKVAGYETRDKEYMHWWSFVGLFNEIGEGLFSTIVSIRSKKNKHKKLEKHELEFYKENKSLIDIKEKLTAEEQAELDYYNSLPL